MKLTKLQLENFRNYPSFTHKFDEGKLITMFSGKNGTGKTNLLEAIYALSLGRSFRSIKQEDMVKWEKDFFRIKGDVMDEGPEITEYEVFYSQAPSRKKSFKKNGVSMKTSNYIGGLLTVFFHPEDLNMLYQEPSLRRKYMDILLSQTNKKYLVALMEYKKILKQRNALLQEIRENKFNNRDNKTLYDDLDAWDKQMAEFGSVIIKNRIDLVWVLNRLLTDIYRSISGGKEKVEVKYANNVLKESAMVKVELEEKQTDEFTAQKIKNLYEKKLRSMQKIEEIQGRTLTGPHRDDLVFYINDKEILVSASRGEVRTLLLAVKLAEIEFIKRVTKMTPILLLDDVFSELDVDRQKKLFSAIEDCQTIITSAENLAVDKANFALLTL